MADIHIGVGAERAMAAGRGARRGAALAALMIVLAPPSFAQGQAPFPIQNPFAALLGQPGPSVTLKPEQRAIVDKVNKYISSVQTLQGNLVQGASDGRAPTPDFYPHTPGRVLFKYDDPRPSELVADGTSVVVRDRKLATQDVYP